MNDYEVYEYDGSGRVLRITNVTAADEYAAKDMVQNSNNSDNTESWFVKLLN